MDYLFLVGSNICIYIMLGVCLNLIFGYGDIVVLCSAAFLGIGAYTSVLLTLAGWNFFPTVLVAMAIAVVVSMVISLPALRVYLDYLILVSIAFHSLTYQAMVNFQGITGGTLGIRNIPPIELFGFVFNTRLSYFLLCLVFAVSCFLAVRYIANSMYGISLMAIGEDELAAKSIGKSVALHKIMAVAIGMSFSAAAGSLFSHQSTYINCESFTLHDTILVVCIVVFGGLRNLWGTVVAAFILVSLPEFLKFLGLTASFTFRMRELIYGLTLVLVLMLRPDGIIGKGESAPQVRLKRIFKGKR